MSMQNLSIVFGPTLFGQHASISGQGGVMADASFQNIVRRFPLISMTYQTDRFFFEHPTQAIETILNHYTDIFIDESE